MDVIWAFLREGQNQATLTWIGGGLVVAAGGIWAIIRFFVNPRSDSGRTKPGVGADNGSIAIGGSNINSPLNTATKPPRKR